MALAQDTIFKNQGTKRLITIKAAKLDFIKLRIYIYNI